MAFSLLPSKSRSTPPKRPSFLAGTSHALRLLDEQASSPAQATLGRACILPATWATAWPPSRASFLSHRFGDGRGWLSVEEKKMKATRSRRRRGCGRWLQSLCHGPVDPPPPRMLCFRASRVLCLDARAICLCSALSRASRVTTMGTSTVVTMGAGGGGDDDGRAGR